MQIDDRLEWLEADGLGGFASGTASGLRTRRYHALLLAATKPPAGRMVLVNGVDAWLETPDGRVALTTQRYAPDVLHPDGSTRITAFSTEPWPRWEFIAGRLRLTHEVVVQKDVGPVLLVWRLLASGSGPVTLCVRPFLSGRDYHSMHHENAAFRFDAETGEGAVQWRPYDGVPAVRVLTNGSYAHAPEWYRRFLYSAERERGLDDIEDLASPGVLSWTLEPNGEAGIMTLAAGESLPWPASRGDVVALASRIQTTERERRAAFESPLDRAADAYLVRRGAGRTIVAGYPWFTDWGRDTFLSIRGLCLATGRLAEARDILVEWAGVVSEGMLPNRFPDGGETPEYNSVDASLWYVVAVHELLQLAEAQPDLLSAAERQTLERAVLAIVRGYAAGTRYGIRMDPSGLLSAGEYGVQLTWMDARVGDRVITPRIGKPVEIQALWLNALAIAARLDPAWDPPFRDGLTAFADRFWYTDGGYLYDVVDDNHVAGAVDATFRPNQVLAVGGLPLAILSGSRARQVVDEVERRLLTPTALRSLAPGSPGYAAHYAGGPAERDGVYHQGTAWPWLLGPFVEAWVQVRGGTPAAREEARQRFLTPMRAGLELAGLGHLAEITDAEPPFTPRGCPFQAWSLGELLRLDRIVLRDETDAAMPVKSRRVRREQVVGGRR